MKRIIALVLVSLLAIGILPISAFTAAAGTYSLTMYQYSSTGSSKKAGQMFVTANGKPAKVVLTGKKVSGCIQGTIEFININHMMCGDLSDYFAEADGCKDYNTKRTLYFRANNDTMFIYPNSKYNNGFMFSVICRVHFNGKQAFSNIVKIDTFSARKTNDYDPIFNFSKYSKEFIAGGCYFKTTPSDNTRVVAGNQSSHTQGTYVAKQSISLRTGPGYNYPEVVIPYSVMAAAPALKRSAAMQTNLSEQAPPIPVEMEPIQNVGNGSVASLVMKNTTLPIMQVQNGWGYTSYRNTNGWIDLNYCSYFGVLITKPVAPTVTLTTKADIPMTGIATATWNSVHDANYYSAVVYDQWGNEKQRADNIYATTASFCLRDAGEYTIKVYGKNSLYTGDAGVANSVVRVHANSTVIFKDWDGTVLAKQKPFYEENATAPLAPDREGYTFQGWDGGSLNSVKADMTLTARYTVNTYSVQFHDFDGSELGAVQKVEYRQSAVEPTPATVENYEFVAWSSEEWKSVYRENKNDVLHIYPVYRWTNQDLPIEVTGTSAARQDDGYTVNYTLTNHSEQSKNVRGRVVVALKSDSGKLLFMTESAAFSLRKNASRTDDIFVPFERAASKAEVYVISDYTNGVPISPVSKIERIDEALMWSDWSETAPQSQQNVTIETRREYRYDLLETVWNALKTKVGTPAWSWTNNWRISKTYTSGWSDSPVSAINTESHVRTIKTKEVALYNSRTMYDYYHWHTYEWGGYYSNTQYASHYSYHTISVDHPLTCWGTTGNTTIEWWGWETCPYGCSQTKFWLPNGTHSETYQSGNKIQYQYTDNFYEYELTRFPGNWSDWSTQSVSATSSRRVETRTMYRSKSSDVAVTQVNDSGVPRTFSYTLDPVFAGKQATFFITKYKAASDFTNEYIGQAVIGPDGSVSFTCKLREEPSAETGDMTVSVGIEGNTDMIVLDTIYAPKASYTVTYMDEDGTVLSAQRVEEGDSAVAPSVNPSKPGSTFAGWNNTATNVRSDLEIRPIYVENTYTVFFVDYRNPANTRMESYKYGDPIVTGDTLTDVDSGFARTWDFSGAETDENGTVIVTDNMIVTAVYETKTYDVIFQNENGEIVDEQTVEYEGVAEIPELIDTEEVTYFGWDVEDKDLMHITESVVVTPEFTYNETTADPQISLESGAYEGEQVVTLTCATEDAVIYYTLDGSNPQENPAAVEYTGPFTVNETAVLNCAAGSLGRNDSDVETAYYVINGDGALVHVFSDLYPDEGETDMYLIRNMEDIDPTFFEVEGETLTGIYTDAMHTQLAVLEGAPTSAEINLYLAYEAQMYTVTFLDNNGNTIETKEARYGETVEPPKMDKIGTMVCTGWEGGSYDFVTESVTLQPVYKDESEIVNLTLSRSNFEIPQGLSFKLKATVTPADKSDLEVIWISEDDTIASVTEDGTVTANKPGTVKIYAVTEDDSAQSYCEVNVIRSSNFSLCLKETAKIGLDSAGNLRGAPVEGNTVSYIASQFANNASALRFVSADGEILTDTDRVGTGATVSLMDGEKVLDTWTVIHTGDIDGNGLVDNRDVAHMSRFVASLETFDTNMQIAADVNADGKLNNRDASFLSRYLVGKETL